jgi:hypothetical protein
MLQPRTVELQGAEQGAKRTAAMGLELERCAAVRARRMGVEKGVELLLEEVALEGAEELFGFGQTQPEMFNALVVLGEGDDIGDGLSLQRHFCVLAKFARVESRFCGCKI